MRLKLKLFTIVILPILLMSNIANLYCSYNLDELPIITIEEIGDTDYTILDTNEDSLIIEMNGKMYVVPNKK